MALGTFLSGLLEAPGFGDRGRWREVRRLEGALPDFCVSLVEGTSKRVCSVAVHLRLSTKTVC